MVSTQSLLHIHLLEVSSFPTNRFAAMWTLLIFPQFFYFVILPFFCIFCSLTLIFSQVVTVHNPSIGLLRRGLQLGVVSNPWWFDHISSIIDNVSSNLEFWFTNVSEIQTGECCVGQFKEIIWEDSSNFKEDILSGFPWSIIHIDIDIGVVSLRWWSSPLITFLIFVFCPLTFLIVLTLPHSPYENNKPTKKSSFLSIFI